MTREQKIERVRAYQARTSQLFRMWLESKCSKERRNLTYQSKHAEKQIMAILQTL